MSGSRYDRVEVKPLSGASYALGSTIKALVESNRARRARGTDAGSPRASSLNVEERAALEQTARVELDKEAEARRGPAPNRIMLDRAHVDTLKIVFSLLDTGAGACSGHPAAAARSDLPTRLPHHDHNAQTWTDA